jgi:hypothetical protein
MTITFVESGTLGHRVRRGFGLIHTFDAAVENDRLMLHHH